MTLDTQHDRPNATLASVSDHIHPAVFDPASAPTEESGDTSFPTEVRSEEPITNTFEAFGSFSG